MNVLATIIYERETLRATKRRCGTRGIANVLLMYGILFDVANRVFPAICPQQLTCFVTICQALNDQTELCFR
jgi:hypothetical protein